jgi:hypothetical protein
MLRPWSKTSMVLCWLVWLSAPVTAAAQPTCARGT